MSIELFRETLVRLSAAAKLLPERPDISTLHRWRLRGVNGIKLETFLIGGRRFTSQEALERFVAAVTAASDGERITPRTPAARERAIAQAERELGTQ